jgi:hypothetical protein
MRILYWRLLALVLWLTLFFNIERLNVGSIDTINLPSPVYLVGLLGVLLGLTGAARRRPLWLLLGACTLLFWAAMVATPGPALGGYHTYLSVTGLLMVLVGATLARWVAQGFDEFQQAVEQISLAGAGRRLRSLDEIQEAVERELDHSRRMQRPLSLVLLQLESGGLRMLAHRFISELQRALAERYTLTLIANTTSRYLRKSNIVAADPASGRLLIIAPETSDAQVEALARRVGQVVSEAFAVETRLSTATLPDDALTFQALHEAAASKLRASSEPSAALAPAKAAGQQPRQPEPIGADH